MEVEILKGKGLARSMTLAVVLLQFIHLPFVGDVNATGKMFVLVLLALGGWLALLSQRLRQFRPAFSPWLAGCILLLAASALRAPLPVDAWVSLGAFGAAVLLMLLAAGLARGEDGFFDLLIRSLTVGGVVCAALGLWQYLHFRLFGPADFQAFTHLAGMLFPYLLPPLPNMRVIGPQGHAIYFGLFQLVVLIALCFLYTHRQVGPCRPWLRPLRYLPVVLVGTSFFLSQSRGCTLALMVLVLFVAWAELRGWYPWEKGKERRGELVRLGLCLFVAWTVFKALAMVDVPSVASAALPSVVDAGRSAASAPGDGGGAERTAATLRSETFSGSNVDGRLVLYLTAALIFRDHPWLGIGLDQYKSFMAEYQVRALNILHLEYATLEYSRWAHNEYLQLLAEGGIGVGLLVGGFLAMLAVNFRRRAIRERIVDPVFFYSHLLLVPFLVESCFSWPLRYGASLGLFSVILGQAVSYLPGRESLVSSGRRRIFTVALCCGLASLAYLLWQETLTRRFSEKLHGENPVLEETVDDLERLTYNPYNEYSALRMFYPLICRRALVVGDEAVGARLLPLGERLTAVEGAYWEWYFLSRLYFMQGRIDDAEEAVRTAIDRRPDYEPAWQWLHHLNMSRVSERTGVPLEVLIREAIDGLEHLNGGNRNH